MSPSVGAVILAGGRSQRMGTDKAYLDLDGQPLLARLAARLQAAGVSPLIVVGGERGKVEQLGLRFVPDGHPGEGPLTGVITGLSTLADASLVFVTACDHPSLDGQLVEALERRANEVLDADAVIPVVDGVRQVLAAVFRPRAVGPLTEQFDSGERSVQRAIESLAVIEVEGLPSEWFADLDTPEDVRHYAAGDGDSGS